MAWLRKRFFQVWLWLMEIELRLGTMPVNSDIGLLVESTESELASMYSFKIFGLRLSLVDDCGRKYFHIEK